MQQQSFREYFFCDSMTIMVRMLTIVPRMEQISALTNAILDQVSFIMIIEPFLAESMIMEQNKSKVFQTLILTMKSVIIT